MVATKKKREKLYDDLGFDVKAMKERDKYLKSIGLKSGGKGMQPIMKKL